MAESSKENEVSSSTEEANPTSEDEELDALLADALKDFSNPDLACPSTTNKAKPMKIEETDCSVLPKKQNAASSKPRESSEPDFDDLFSEESFAKMAEQFSKAFESMQPDDLELLQKMDEQEDASGNQDDVKPSLEENLKKAWSSLEQNIQDTKKDLPDDILDDDFLNAMKGLGMDGSEGGPEGLMSMMQGMMTNLLSKDILYPSLKEIQTKYPSWLDENQSSLSREDNERYGRQQELVSRICIEFEAETDNDSEETKKRRLERIMGWMQEMQACGQPPFELLEPTDNDLELDSGQPTSNIPNPDQCAVM